MKHYQLGEAEVFAGGADVGKWGKAGIQEEAFRSSSCYSVKISVSCKSELAAHKMNMRSAPLSRIQSNAFIQHATYDHAIKSRLSISRLRSVTPTQDRRIATSSSLNRASMHFAPNALEQPLESLQVTIDLSNA